MSLASSTSGARSEPSAATSTGCFSCVVDDDARFHLEALRWFASLTVVAGVSPTDLVVHLVGATSSDILDHLGSEGVLIRRIERFDPRSPHCNKISGALRLAEDRVGGTAVLCDTDLALLEDPRRLAIPSHAVAGKPVDAPVPPLDVVLDVFRVAGVGVPTAVPLPWDAGQSTVSGNNNGGLYLVPGPVLAGVAAAWARWALWLLDRPELLGEWSTYVDQVSMALGLADEGIESIPLAVEWNTPTHDLSRIPGDAPTPVGIHYHQEVDAEGRIRHTGNGNIDAQIDVVNAVFDDSRRAAFGPADSRPSRDTGPDPASVAADDGGRPSLAALLRILAPESVLEVTGTGGSPGSLSLKRYNRAVVSDHGLTGSSEERRVPGGRLAGVLADHGLDAEVTVCLDVVTRQPERSAYRSLVAQLWRSSRRGLVVSGFESPSVSGDPDARYYEPLSSTLQQVAPDAEIYPVGHDGPVTTFVVLRPPSEGHPRDYKGSTLTPLIGRHPDPVLLLALRLHARRTTGFYPDHAPRLWEYPVVAGLLMEQLPPGSRLVDVGAGVTPLAPFLTSRGYLVDTVDPSETRRSWPPQPDWNEWDFLDYGSVGLAHRSWNCTLGELPVRPPYDGMYSVSVIEHVPAVVRRALLSEISQRTRPGGMVVLTIDLVRGEEALWNRNLGIEVEEPGEHGSFRDVVGEGSDVGLELVDRQIVRSWGDTNVDIGLLHLRQSGRDSVRGRGVARWIRSRRRRAP